MKIFYTYILKCADGKYYTGVTNNIDRRIAEHNEGINPASFTYCRRPVKLLYYADFSDPMSAINFEKQIKGWSRKKKEALMAEDWNKLVELSKSRKHNE